MFQWLIYIAIVATAFGILFYQLRKLLKAAASQDPNESMPQFAARAVSVATSRGVTLDNSFESVKLVETLLAKLHEFRSRRQLTDREVQNNAMNFGAYIGEILRKKYNGSWSRDSAVAGPGSFPMKFNGGETYPVGWCGKRILNGDEDNVWHKFQVIISKQPPPETAAPPITDTTPILKIAVFLDGSFTLNQSPANLDQLRQALEQRAEQKGAVWYYRQAAKGEPPPIALQIMQEIIKAKLPIRLSSRPDYSDSIGPEGRSN